MYYSCNRIGNLLGKSTTGNATTAMKRDTRIRTVLLVKGGGGGGGEGGKYSSQADEGVGQDIRI